MRAHRLPIHKRIAFTSIYSGVEGRREPEGQRRVLQASVLLSVVGSRLWVLMGSHTQHPLGQRWSAVIDCLSAAKAL